MIPAGQAGCVLPETTLKPTELSGGLTVNKTAPCLSKAANLVNNASRIEECVLVTAVNRRLVEPARNDGTAPFAE